MPVKLPLISFLSVFSPIGTGLLIYILFRGIPYLHIKELIVIPNKSNVLSFCIYNLPDALWLSGLLQAFKVIWQEQIYIKGLPWVIGCIIGAILSEYAQKLHIIPGTFDWLDIASYILAATTFMLINTLPFINQNKLIV